MKISISVDEVADGRHIAFEEKFEELFVDLDGARDIALFSRTRYEGTTVWLELYVSPAATRPLEALLREYGGVPSDSPAQYNDTVLVIGHPAAWEELL